LTDEVEAIGDQVGEVIAREHAVFTASLEDRDRDHQGAGELEGVVLGKERSFDS
jgi:hypothetical protein